MTVPVAITEPDPRELLKWIAVGTMQASDDFLAQLASEPDRSKLRLPGTDRAQTPAAALAMATRAAPLVGITRLADITRLDVIGIPTFQAVRPMSRTLAVAQGKGVTPELAKLSAIMESIETWHVEQPIVPVTTAAPRAVSGQLTYDVHDLPRSTPSLLHEGLPLDWVVGRSLADGAETLVPTGAVRLSFEQKVGWNPPAFFESTNGLASGNTLVEAALHALYEVIERDAVTAAVLSGELGVRVDPATLGSPLVDQLCALIARAGVSLEVRLVASPTGLPCFVSRVACDDYPLSISGFGCHLSSEIALTRAITEAAQARLAYISGARDDIRSEAYRDVGKKQPPAPSGPEADMGSIPEVVANERLVEDLDYVVRQATAAFSYPPLLVDLTREEIGVPVVKVVVPGSRIIPEVL